MLGVSPPLSPSPRSILTFERRWGQVYILESLMNFVPQTHEDADILAERISVRLQHANSAIVLTSIKVLLYLMNYMESNRAKEVLCKKMGPPLGKPNSRLCVLRTNPDLIRLASSHAPIFGSRSAICRPSQHFADHSEETDGAEERRQGVLLQIQRPRICQAREAGDHVPPGEPGECEDCIG